MSLRKIKLLAGMLGALVAATALRAETKVGDAFPEPAAAGVTALSGGSVPELRGQVTLVDFWASWCAPCKASFPAMAKLQTDYASKGLRIFAVSVDEKQSAALGFWKKMTPPFLGLHDAGKKLVDQVNVPGMPTSYLVGRDGRVRYIHQGFHGDSTDREVRKEIETLLAEK